MSEPLKKVQRTQNEYFRNIPKIEYAGATTDSPLSFRYYSPDKLVLGRPMKDWLRFSVCYWHTFRGNGADPFGLPGTISRSWDDGTNSLENALRRVHVAFEFFQKLGVEYYTFHDVDVSPEGSTLAESNSNLDKVTELMLQLQEETGIKPLWATCNLFTNKRYMNGAATNPDIRVFARAAAQVKKGLEVAKKLGASSFVFWGGREGYQTLLNTKIGEELKHYALLLKMAIKYSKEINYDCQFLIEPKPREPTKHQYDYDVMTVVGFLYKFGLQDDIKLNIEPNHGQLAGHSFAHDVIMAQQIGFLGSIDANTGSEGIGWDTDEFVTDPRGATLIMSAILDNGGLGPIGGLNFDAKVRRESVDVEDMFIAHISSMDCFAKGLLAAAKLRETKIISTMLDERYETFDPNSKAVSNKIQALAQSVRDESSTLQSMEEFVLSSTEPEPPIKSGKEELYDMMFSRIIMDA